jgi:alpha-1,6-mannosyltransferase
VSHAPATRISVAPYLALVAAVVSSVLLIAEAPRHATTSAFLVVCATAGCGAVAVLERRARRLGGFVVAVAIAVVMVTAVVTPPRTSNDLWSYGAYGRMVAVHHADAYVATPSDFPNDPFSKRVSGIWQHRSSVYGPVWIGVASLDAMIVGGSTLGNRLFFQLIAAVAASIILFVVWRRTRSSAALAWLGLHPAFVAISVNGGHADLLIGLAILVAALLATRGKGWTAGLVVGLGALIKVTALLGVAGIALWAWRAKRWRLAVAAAVAAGATLLLGYLPLIGEASHVLANADHTVTLASPWNWLADLLLGHDAWRQVVHPLAFNQTLDLIFFAGVVLVATLALVLGWRAAATRDARPAAGTTTASYVFGASYALPWYADWSLPSFADHVPAPVAWIVWLQAAVALTALKMHDHPAGTLDDALLRGLFTFGMPIVLLASFVIVGLRRSSGDATEMPTELLTTIDR